MYYYEVLAGSSKYHGQGALTYQSDEELKPGQVVGIPLRQCPVLGIIRKQVPKPAFVTKSIHDVFNIRSLPAQSLQLLTWLQTYYAAPLGSVVQQFLPKTLLNKPKPTSVTDKKTIVVPILPTLTAEQKTVLGSIKQTGTYLLHGETGSGKTRIYTELAGRALQTGQSAIILTPEISLTSQLAATFEALFPCQVVVVHSHLTDAERRTLWLGVLQADTPLVIIGAIS